MEVTRARIIAACNETVEEMRADWVPNPRTRYKTSTGNMAFNALCYAVEGDIFRVWIEESIAPYVWYTIKPWLSPRWRGKKNPNQDWDRIFREEFVERVARKLGAEVRYTP